MSNKRQTTEQQSPSTSTPPPLRYNFLYIKRLAQPGSWRRGYGYYRTNQVQEIRATETGVYGTVKGNYKDHYTVVLTFQETGVTAACDCPLSEEWCKHAVAVGLVSIQQHLWEDFWEIPPYNPNVPCNQNSNAFDWNGHYRFVLDNQQKPKHLSVQVVDRTNQQPVPKLETVLQAAVALQKSSDSQPFNEVEKREFLLMQLLLKSGEAVKNGWFHVPQIEVGNLLNQLAVMEEVCDAHTQSRLTFEDRPLSLWLSVNISMVGNVLLSLHWKQEDPEEMVPLEEVTLYGKEVPWGRLNNRFFPLENTLKMLPNALTRSSFTDIRDADGGKFIFEELPDLRKKIAVEEADIIDKIQLEKVPPTPVLFLEKYGAEAIRGKLEFRYGTTMVPYSRTSPATPYITSIKEAEQRIDWIYREAKREKSVFDRLAKSHLSPLQTNQFSAETLDDAIDFYNFDLPGLGSDWDVVEEDDLSFFKVAPHPLRIKVALDFAETTDKFTLDIACAVGETEIDLDTVQGYLQEGKKYFYLEGQGYVEVPLAVILQFTRTLSVFDAEKIGEDHFQIQTYKAGLIAELLDQGVELLMTPAFQKFWDQMSAFQTLESVPLSKNVQAELRPYQKHGFNWLWFLYSYGLNGILADDMGLGKTLQTLTLIQKAKDEDGPAPSLIVCPTSVVYNWENEIRRFTPDLKVLNLTGSERHFSFKEIPNYDVILTSYALLRRDINAIKRYPLRLVVLDESQNIKNIESQTAQASKQLQAGHRLALSGTPIENRLSELWSVFDFLMPGFLYDYDEFKYRYAAPIEEKGNRDAEMRLKRQLFPFILRRLKKDVAKDLPDKIENTYYCDMLPDQLELYKEILKKARDEVFQKVSESGIGGSQMSIFSALLRLRQVCCHPKLVEATAESGKFEALQEMLEEVMSEGHRILLFSQFVEMLKIIRAWLEVEGIKYEYLTGDTPAGDRPGIVHRFNSDDSIPIFLISLKAGGTGLNLTGADYVIHYDPWWNPAAEAQATDRAHRIGQTKNVFVYRFITKGTVEEKIMKLKERKQNLVDSIIAADRDFAKSLTMDDLKDIFSPNF